MKNAALALVLLLCASAAPAQNAALVRELLTVSGAEKQYEQMMGIMTESMRNGFNRGFSEALKGKPADAAKLERARAIADRYMQELQRGFVEEVRRVMPYERLVTEVYGPLYEKNFSAAELGDAIAFFKSPAGRKFAAATPGLMQDASRIINERYLPQLVRSTSQQMETLTKRMIEELNKL